MSSCLQEQIRILVSYFIKMNDETWLAALGKITNFVLIFISTNFKASD